jgi:hypothetical protein
MNRHHDRSAANQREGKSNQNDELFHLTRQLRGGESGRRRRPHRVAPFEFESGPF